MKTTNKQLAKEWATTSNVVTRNSLENILLNRCSRGDIEAGKILHSLLRGWVV